MHLFFDEPNEVFIFECRFAEKEIAKDAGFWWDKTRKVWYTSDIFNAIKLSHYADNATMEMLQDNWSGTNENYMLSMAESSSIEVPAPKGLEYFGYQKAGIEYLLKNEGVLLGDEMGLGKTIQVIGLINHLNDVLKDDFDSKYNRLEKVLIVCPAHLKLNWAKELKTWLCSNLTYGIADGSWFPKHHDIAVINYEILAKHELILQKTRWDLIVADEGHYLKNPNSQRSENFYALNAPRRIIVTGTPISNRPKELFPLISWLRPDRFPKFITFAIRYCGAVKGEGDRWNFNGDSNLDELNARLRATLMIRRLKNEVLKDLPDKIRQVIELPAPRAARSLLASELGAYDEREETLATLRAAIKEAKTANDTAAYDAAVRSFQSVTGQILSSIAKVRKEVALIKAPLVAEHVRTIVDTGQKVVVFAHHHDVIDLIYDSFPKEMVVKLDGRDSAVEKDRSVQRFQNSSDCMVFIGALTAAGTGITLTAASTVVFAELDWVPGNLSQCEDRCHRIGQKNSVLVQHIVLENSLDFRIANRIVEKQYVIDAAMNNKSVHLQQHSSAAVRPQQTSIGG